MLAVRRFMSSRYQPRRPADTVLYHLVSEHLETFLRHARDEYQHDLPRYVEQELRQYLKCGIFAHGFARAYCRECGRSLLVAFSCKRRGACPSCATRRMCDTAAHLVDRVIPDVPLRQWVLSVPFELRLLLATNPSALSVTGRIFIQEVFRWQRDRAGERGLPGARGAAVQFPHRFGGSLNVNVHYHAAVVDGVFTRQPSKPRAVFHRLPKPSRSDLDDIALNVATRVTRWLRRHGLLHEEQPDTQEPDPSALDACLQSSLGVGELVTLPGVGGTRSGEDSVPRPPKSDRRGGHCRGFNVHAGVVIGAQDRDGRERLLRYCARPPLSLERLTVTPQGLVAYRVRKPWQAERTHRLMTPLQFMARLAALVPPPRHPLIRFHGVFAPHSSWRASVVPERRARDEPGAECHDKARTPAGAASAAVRPDSAEAAAPSSNDTAGSRPLGSYIDWATLLKRTYHVDALRCPCGGRLRFIAVITDPATARALLEHLSLPADPPPLARARAPDLDFVEPALDWD